MSHQALAILQALESSAELLSPAEISERLGDVEQAAEARTLALLRRLADCGLIERTHFGNHRITVAGAMWLATATEDTPLPETPKGTRLALIAERAEALRETKAPAAETPAPAVETIPAARETPAPETATEVPMPRSTPPAAAGTKTSRILQALAEAEFQISTDDVLAALGEKGADARRKLLGLLSFLKRTGRAAGNDADGWTNVAAKPAKAAKPRKERAVAVVEPQPAAVATVTPPGSVAVTDDGSVLLLDGDRIAARLTAQQAANVAALVQRYSGAA